MSAVHLSYDPAELPLSWDLSSGLASPVVDQGWCDNSWAVSALAVAADRQDTVICWWREYLQGVILYSCQANTATH